MAETKCTPERIEAICDYIKLGMSIADIADLVGIRRETYHNWIRRGESGEEPYLTFLTAVTRARPHFKLFHVNNINRIAKERKDDGVSLRASQFMLERKFPDEFGKGQRDDDSGDKLRELVDAINGYIATPGADEQEDGGE